MLYSVHFVEKYVERQRDTNTTFLVMLKAFTSQIPSYIYALNVKDLLRQKRLWISILYRGIRDRQI